MSELGGLRRHPVFASASDTSLGRLLSRSKRQIYASAELILADGDPARHVYALQQGAVRVFHTAPSGDEVVVKLFRAPAVFGEAEALGRVPSYLESVDAVERSEVLMMPAEAVLELLRAEPECAVRLLIDVAERLAIASYNEKSLAFNPATVRLANYLVDYAEWSNPPGSGTCRIDLTQDQMAAAVGITRRSVAKDIIAWQQEGVLQRKGGGYLVLNMEALRRYSDHERLKLFFSSRGSSHK